MKNIYIKGKPGFMWDSPFYNENVRSKNGNNTIMITRVLGFSPRPEFA